MFTGIAPTDLNIFGATVPKVLIFNPLKSSILVMGFLEIILYTGNALKLKGYKLLFL